MLSCLKWVTINSTTNSILGLILNIARANTNFFLSLSASGKICSVFLFQSCFQKVNTWSFKYLFFLITAKVQSYHSYNSVKEYFKNTEQYIYKQANITTQAA